jgi:hypothetical protein
MDLHRVFLTEEEGWGWTRSRRLVPDKDNRFYAITVFHQLALQDLSPETVSVFFRDPPGLFSAV